MEPYSVIQKMPKLPLVLSCLLLGPGLAVQAQARELTLPDTIQLALNKNIGLQRSQVSVDLGENSLESAKADKKPNLTMSGSVSENIDSDGQDSIFTGGAETSESARLSLNSSVILYDGGEIEASIEAAKADLEASELDYDRDRQALLLNTVSTFLQAVVRERQVEIREEELANQEEQLERIQLDFDNGIRPKTEVLRQQALLSQRKSRLIEAQRLYEVSLYSLKDILLIPAEEEITCSYPTASWSESSSIMEPNLGDSLRSQVSRLDLEAQRARLRAAEQDILVAEAGDNLSVSANANLSTSYNSGVGPGSFGDKFFERNPSATASLSFNLPIWDRRRTETNVIRSQLIKKQQELIYQNLLQTARTSLFRSFLNFDSAKAQLETAEEQLASTDEALQAEQARYEAGAATLLELNTLRSTRLDAAVSAEEARFDLFTSRLDVSFQDGTIESFLLQQLEDLDPTLF
ncbi:MAG: TolC family protein [Puniceicoccaceae bacterium]